MIRLDSCKLYFDESVINNYDKNYFICDYRADNLENKLLKTTNTLKKEYLPFGVKNIIFEEVGNNKKINIELSGKAMKQEYFELINKNNVELLVDNLNDNKGITFDKNKFIDNCNVYRIDNTYNLRVEKDISEYISALFQYKTSLKYDLKKYDNGGLTIIKDVRTAAYKERMIFYNKFDEIIKDKQLHKYINVNQFNHILRCEVNLRSLEQIRKHLGIEKNEKVKNKIQDIKLITCLESLKNPNYEILNNFTSDINNELFKEYLGKNITIREIINDYGMKNIIKMLNFDIKLIREFIRKHSDKNTKPSYWNKKFKDKLKEMLCYEIKIDKSDIYLDEIKSLLLIA